MRNGASVGGQGPVTSPTLPGRKVIIFLQFNKGLVALASLLSVATLVLFLIVGCGKPSPSDVQKAGPFLTPAVAEFVGDAACTECHSAESEVHKRTRHAHTLRKMDRESLGALAPEPGRMGQTGYVLLTDGDHFAISAERYRDKVADLNLALGSGKTGMTYVHAAGDRLAEAEMSYFPPYKKWYRTPGHSEKPEYMLGQMYTGAFPRQCIGCHAVTLPPDSVVPEEKFFGVGCESCHGPSSLHIAAARTRGARDLKIEKLAAVSAEKLNDEVCGKCHLPFSPTGGKLTSDSEETHRFQPIGIEKSACFIKGGKTLSCMTCHDAHTDVSTDHRKYESVCLSCHASPPAANPIASVKPVSAKPCPVNAKADCVPCHMPARRIFKDSNVPTTLADHYIRVYKSRQRVSRK